MAYYEFSYFIPLKPYEDGDLYHVFNRIRDAGAEEVTYNSHTKSVYIDIQCEVDKKKMDEALRGLSDFINKPAIYPYSCDWSPKTLYIGPPSQEANAYSEYALKEIQQHLSMLNRGSLDILRLTVAKMMVE